MLKDITDDYLIPKHKYKNKDSLSSSTEESSRRRSSSKHEITWNESIRGNRFLSNNGEILYLLKIFLKRYWSYLKRVLSVE